MIEKVKVAGISYSVLVKPYVEIGGDRNFKGSCDLNHAIIELSNDLNIEVFHDTFIHELTHAISNEANVELEEEEILRLGKVLYQVLKDNDLSFLKGEKHD